MPMEQDAGHLVRYYRLPEGTMVAIRPVVPQDAECIQAFVRNLSPQSRYKRFFSAIPELPPEFLTRFTYVDYQRHMTLVAISRDQKHLIGVAQYAPLANAVDSEFAIVVADTWQHRGVGSALLDSLMQCACATSYESLVADVIANNAPMLKLARSRGFAIRFNPESPTLMRIRTRLAEFCPGKSAGAGSSTSSGQARVS